MAVVQIKGSTSLSPTPNNGQWRLAERIFYTQELAGPYALAMSWGISFPRGSVWTLGGLNGYFWVEESTVNSERGGKGVTRQTFAWMGSAPPHEWSITPFEINPPLLRNNYFSGLTADQVQQVKMSLDTITAQGMAAISAAIAASSSSALMQKLLQKWLQGKETFYLAGLKYIWTQYYTGWSGTTLRGGYRENPLYSVNGAGPGSAYLPQGGWDYLREADEMVWANGLYKVTRTWIGAPGGFWDTDLYGTIPQ